MSERVAAGEIFEKDCPRSSERPRSADAGPVRLTNDSPRNVAFFR